MLTQESLKELLSYDPDTGFFTYLVSKKGWVRKGYRAGSIHCDGYRHISIGGRLWLEHRLAWLYMTGEWPEFKIDHRDGERSNNAWLNLRSATDQQNSFNQKVRSSNTSGFRNVRFVTDGLGYLSARASTRVNGNNYMRAFSVSKYGIIAATAMAVLAEREMREELHKEFCFETSRAT